MIGLSRRILDSMLLGYADLTHEVLVTFMAEVCAIMNARPIVPVSTDPECPDVLSPNALLTQKIRQETGSLTTGDPKDIYRSQWKRVQVLADSFWNKWKSQYLHTLQERQKWPSKRPNIKDGDVVLLADKASPRNQWTLAVVSTAIPSEDGLVRKAVVRTFRDGKVTFYTRPVTELVLLVSKTLNV